MKLLFEKFALAALFLLSALLMYGFVFMTLWNWFIVSIFHGPVISIAQSIAIASVFKYLYPSFNHDIKEATRQNLRKFFRELIVSSLVTLTIGWIIKYFI